MRYALVLVLLAEVALPAMAAHPVCERAPRTLDPHASPHRVAIDKGQWTELRMIAPIQGLEADQPDALDITLPGFPDGAAPIPTLADRVLVRLRDDADDMHTSMLTVHDQKGQSYFFHLIQRPGCADLSVRFPPGLPEALPKRADGAKGRTLIHYMLVGEIAPGYQVEPIRGPATDRLVFQDGPVDFYLEQVWHGKAYTGYVLRVVNTSRIPYHVALQSMDFNAPGMIDRFGQITGISMRPYDFRLGPAPEFAVDAMHPTHQGTVFIEALNPEVVDGAR